MTHDRPRHVRLVDRLDLLVGQFQMNTSCEWEIQRECFTRQVRSDTGPVRTDEVSQLLNAGRTNDGSGDEWLGQRPRKGDLSHANATSLCNRSNSKMDGKRECHG